jgi:class 3 adenylate cyclase
MACAGLKSLENFYNKKLMKNPVERLIELALGMLQEILTFKFGNNQKQISLKIGVNYGRVLMGVIGYVSVVLSKVHETSVFFGRRYGQHDK